MSAILRAAGRWRGRVTVIVEGRPRLTAKAPCPCRGLGLVPRAVMVRGSVRYTFDPCPNGCEENQGVS